MYRPVTTGCTIRILIETTQARLSESKLWHAPVVVTRGPCRGPLATEPQVFFASLFISCAAAEAATYAPPQASAYFDCVLWRQVARAHLYRLESPGRSHGVDDDNDNGA